jgi:hypothetical protein
MDTATLKKLARSGRFQMIYSRSKEINNIHLFRNCIEFTPVQIMFLSYLEVYHQLYQDLYLKELYISEEVIEDDLRCEAYLLWKNTKKEKESKSSTTGTSDGSVIFRRSKD